jgi:hypothetical protein
METDTNVYPAYFALAKGSKSWRSEGHLRVSKGPGRSSIGCPGGEALGKAQGLNFHAFTDIKKTKRNLHPKLKYNNLLVYGVLY